MDLAEMEGKCHPRDWVEVYERHTPYEWALQLARYKVYPFGSRRADLCAGWNTSKLMASNSTEQVSFEKVKEVAEALANYVRFYIPKDELE